MSPEIMSASPSKIRDNDRNGDPGFAADIATVCNTLEGRVIQEQRDGQTLKNLRVHVRFLVGVAHANMILISDQTKKITLGPDIHIVNDSTSPQNKRLTTYFLAPEPELKPSARVCYPKFTRHPTPG